MISIKKIVKLVFITITLISYTLVNSTQPASSLVPSEPCTEADLYAAGVVVVNCTGENICPAVASPIAASSGSPLANGSSIYMLGDSITSAAQSVLRSQIATMPNGYTFSAINADGGRAITYDSAGGQPDGLASVSADSTVIRLSDAVVIALGTNSGNENLATEIPALITAVRNTGFTGQIYWVDLFYTTGSATERNGSIMSFANTGDATSQRLYNVIRASEATIELSGDGIHPTANGSQQFAETVLNGVASIPTDVALVQPTSNGSCQCSVSASGGLNVPVINTSITWGTGVWGPGSDIYQSGLTGPYTIEQWAIHVLKNISRKSGIPESQLVTESKVISLIAWSRAEGGGINGNNGTFNPLNTKLDHDDLQGVNQGNAATDSNSQGYPTFDIGVEAITRGLFGRFQKRIGSALLQPNFPQDALIEAVAGNFSSPDGVTIVNNLATVYPGDLAYATLSITGFDYGGGIGNRDTYVSIKRDTLNDVRSNYAQYASVLLDGSPPGTPAPLVYSPTGASIGNNYTGGSCSQAPVGGGEVNADGYAFPLAPQTKAGVSGVTVGQTEPTHHDRTAAFDLFSIVQSADVYSLYSGTIIRVNTNFNDVPGCTTIQFRGDDGFYYFYGHLKEPIVLPNTRVEAGVKIAEVADASFGTRCYGGGPHLHIDRGCTINGVPQTAGRDECRDPNFIPLLSALYESLP